MGWFSETNLVASLSEHDPCPCLALTKLDIKLSEACCKSLLRSRVCRCFILHRPDTKLRCTKKDNWLQEFPYRKSNHRDLFVLYHLNIGVSMVFKRQRGLQLSVQAQQKPPNIWDHMGHVHPNTSHSRL